MFWTKKYLAERYTGHNIIGQIHVGQKYFGQINIGQNYFGRSVVFPCSWPLIMSI